MSRRVLWVMVLLLAAPTALADTFLEDFESYEPDAFVPDTTPDQDWYDYAENTAIGLVSTDAPTINGAQHMLFQAENSTTVDSSSRQGSFSLEVPAQLTSTTFYVKGVPLANSTLGSQQFVFVESSAPARSLVEFFVFCTNTTYTGGCELRVRFDHIDTVGQILVNASLNITLFKIRMVIDWTDGSYNLFVNDVDDGEFHFLELATDVGRLRMGQYRSTVPLNMSFDDWTVVGTINGTGSSVESDVANGIKNFATDIRFTSTGSKFFLGILIFLVLCAAVIVPLLALGLDNTVIPAIGFFAVLASLWLVYMEFWPDWVGIAMIVIVAALVGFITRRLFLGISNSAGGASLVVGSLGYFIIASSLLAFSGYASTEVQVPTGFADDNDNETEDQATFVQQVGTCTIKIISFGLAGACDRDGATKIVTKIKEVFSWAKASFTFLFQLVAFQLPIPVIFNMMIVLPPAVALVTFAIMLVRGVATS